MKQNLNIKLLNAVQKGLNEALSNYDLTVLDNENNDSVLVKNDIYKHQSIYNDIIDRNMSEFLNDDEVFKMTVEKMILVGRQYIAKDKDELKTIINKSIKIFGNECDLNWIDTSLITDMSGLFYEMTDFNGYIENWDVSNVENMCSMFYNAESFNQSISDWDVNNVTNMNAMFYGAESFNQPIYNWDVSNVENMSGMFSWTKFFNQPIGDWNVSNVEDMQCMFNHAKSFNQPIGNWDTSNVKYMSFMFNSAESFNQPIKVWDISKVDRNINIFCDCPIKEEYKPKFKK